MFLSRCWRFHRSWPSPFLPWFFFITLALILIAGFWFARGALVVALAIPTSIVGTFLILSLLGRSLNVISLAGLAFAIGMLVDNAVVVLENVVRFSQKGHKPFEAARLAAIEVWGAVLASTLTTLAVFLPVIFLEGEAGQLFLDIALAISAAVGLSLVVSIVVIPTASARILKPHRGASTPGRIESVFNRIREMGHQPGGQRQRLDSTRHRTPSLRRRAAVRGSDRYLVLLLPKSRISADRQSQLDHQSRFVSTWLQRRTTRINGERDRNKTSKILELRSGIRRTA